MAQLLARSVGNLFFAALLPGMPLSALYLGYILVRCALQPGVAPIVALQLVGLALVMAFPGIALWLPRTFLN